MENRRRLINKQVDYYGRPGINMSGAAARTGVENKK